MATSVQYEMNGVSLERNSDTGVFTITMARQENRFNPELCHALGQCLTRVEHASHPKALVITEQGKFFSNGLDLEWMQTNPEGTPHLISSLVWSVLARILVLDCRTVAAINGHAFGAGLFLALSCDYRIMRTQRGYVNFPEVNLGMRLAKVSAATANSSKRAGSRWEAFSDHAVENISMETIDLCVLF